MAKKQNMTEEQLKAIETYKKMLDESVRDLASHRLPTTEEIPLHVASIQAERETKGIEVTNSDEKITPWTLEGSIKASEYDKRENQR